MRSTRLTTDSTPFPAARRARAAARPASPVSAALLVAACVCLLASAAFPASASAQSITFSITQASISFPDADPDNTPSIPASSNVTVNYKVTSNAAGNWLITVIAATDLTSGLATIPISNVTWTATPVPPFQAGTMNTSVQQTVASGSGNVSTTKTGTMVFRLANAWAYNVGNYTATFTFTMTAP